jgi:hypothetical protein
MFDLWDEIRRGINNFLRTAELNKANVSNRRDQLGVTIDEVRQMVQVLEQLGQPARAVWKPGVAKASDAEVSKQFYTLALCDRKVNLPSHHRFAMEGFHIALLYRTQLRNPGSNRESG